jgi:hypothetical protein
MFNTIMMADVGHLFVIVARQPIDGVTTPPLGPSTTSICPGSSVKSRCSNKRRSLRLQLRLRVSSKADEDIHESGIKVPED